MAVLVDQAPFVQVPFDRPTFEPEAVRTRNRSNRKPFRQEVTATGRTAWPRTHRG
jgi:hypothetical protein